MEHYIHIDNYASEFTVDKDKDKDKDNDKGKVLKRSNMCNIFEKQRV